MCLWLFSEALVWLQCLEQGGLSGKTTFNENALIRVVVPEIPSIF